MPTSGNSAFSPKPIQLELDLRFEPDETRFRQLGHLLCSPSRKLTIESTGLIDGVST